MKIILLPFAITITLCASAQTWQNPPTKTVDSADTYFGVTYQDPYRWIENMKDKEVVDWFKQQANFTDGIMNTLNGRDELIKEWKMLDSIQPPMIIPMEWNGGRLFYEKIMPGEATGKLYYREGMDGNEVLLFDPTTYIKGKTLVFKKVLASHDGKRAAILLAEAGSEIGTIKVLDVDKRTVMDETIYPSWEGPISWTFDNIAFTYSSLKTADNTSMDLTANAQVKLHKLGDDVGNDVDIFSNKSYPSLNIPSNLNPSAGTNKDSRKYIFGELTNVKRQKIVYYADIRELGGKINWKVLCTPEDGLVKGMEIIGDDIYAISSKDARNLKVVHTRMDHIDWKNAEIIIAEKPDLFLESITHCKDFLMATYSDGINSRLYKYNLKTKKSSEVKLPYSGIVRIFCLDQTTNMCSSSLTTWNKPYTEFDTDFTTDIFLPGKLNKPMSYPKAYTDLVSKEVEVKGHDGKMIPLSIIYKKGMRLDGSNICIMEGYGAYGMSMTPWFDPMMVTLAVKNVVIATAHVRGGGEKGEEWHKGGYKTTKPNTWKDFNSCAEYLISEGYTSKGNIGGIGGSAGGILISRAITERPDLYGAVICDVGAANIMRMEFTPNGPANILEFGTVKDSIECRALYEMDGVQHVVKRANYPAMMSVAGWNDPRVIPWQPAKFAAAIQNATASDKPVLLKVNYNSGHFSEDMDVNYTNFADQYAFLLWQCGHPDFQLKN